MITEQTLTTVYPSEHLLGQFLNTDHYDTLIESDHDCYVAGSSLLGGADRTIAFKFRKNFFTQAEQDAARTGLWTCAHTTDTRGLASGPVEAKVGTRTIVSDYHHDVLEFFLNPSATVFGEWDLAAIQAEYAAGCALRTGTRGFVWIESRIRQDAFEIDRWIAETNTLAPESRRAEAQRVFDRYISSTTYANRVRSGIAGWFDRYPRLPYGRPTAFTQDCPEAFAKSFPLLRHLAKGMKRLAPDRYAAQMSAVKSIDPKFVVSGTPFTTITVNRTFRTAAHRDGGDLESGISNLTVLSNTGRYSGGYLVFPEIRTAVDVRPGDLLVVDNHRFIHGNTQIEVADDEAERMALVCYFREGMLKLGSYAYEECRFQFTQDRKANCDHPLQQLYANKSHPWQGVSANMWTSQEWYDYLERHMGREVVEQYHPEAYMTMPSLADFFVGPS